MTPRQISLVQATFAPLGGSADAVAQAFYARLFQLDPSLRAMFASDLTTQRAKLMQMLAAALRGLDDLNSLLPTVRSLGRRHAGYGVADAHYDTVGRALRDTLRDGLGAAFTPEIEQAWAAVYAALAGAMRDGALANQPLAA